MAAAKADAQNRFVPALQVGDTIITSYQIDQRTRFLALLGAPGDPREVAREQLINEAVQLIAARENQIEPSQPEIEAGIAEFAGRANLSPEQFITALGQEGVSPATFRDFITAGVAWRSTVRARFGQELRRAVTPIQVQRVQARTGTEGGLRVLISEIILPLSTTETARASRDRAARLASLDGEADFAAAARKFSIAPTANRGGEIGWIAIESLPSEVQATIRAITPGQVSRPIEIGETIGLFLMRDREQVAPGTPETLSIDYALYTAASAGEAARVAQQVEVCDDLYAVAKGLPENRLIRETRPAPSLPSDIRGAIELLDANEATTALQRSGAATVLMLCSRSPALESTVDAEIIGNRLLNDRLSTSAQHYLSELRASSDVIELN
ncbi:MAG: peptidylprolyl isomerase [Pseudomonadota bacterium]